MRRFRLVVAMLVAWVGLIEGQNQPPVFRVNADSVAVNVAVKKGNIPASGLVAQDFRVYDNDVLQRVEAVSQDAVPLDVSIVVDLSASAFRDLETPREAVRRMVSFLRPDDRFRILTMGVSVVNAVPWQLAGQPDVSGIQFVLGYRSLVADGVLVGLLYRSDPDRRHLVVALTDGQDICSVTSGESLRRAAERSGAVFHWVNLGLGAQPFKSFARSNGVEVDCNHKGAATDLGSVLSNATRLTGGSVHDARSGNDVIGIARFFDAILDDFRRSYILHYEPAGVPRAGWHRLRVELAEKGYTVRARPGYWGPEAESAGR